MEGTINSPADTAVLLEEQARDFSLLEGSEIISRREECVKHFDLGAGRRQAVVFAEPVHYQETGESDMCEIDNTLEAAVSGSRNVYRNRANPMQAEFPARVDNVDLVKLTHKGRTLSWRFEQPMNAVTPQVKDGIALKREELLKKATIVKEQAAAKAAEATAMSGATLADTISMPGLDTAALTALVQAEDIATLSTEQLDKAVRSPAERRGSRIEKDAELTYENLLPGVSARYRLQGMHIKEDIIVANVEALANLALHLCGDFDYTIEENQSVRALDKATGEELFSFARPLAYDSAGAEEIAEVSLEPCEGYMRLAYRLPEDYLANAVFPITIDPVVRASSAISDVEDTYIWIRSGYTNTNFGDVYLMRSGHGEHGESISLIKFTKLASQRASDTIINAQLALKPEEYMSTNEYMACYEITAPWTEMGATWNNMAPDTTEKISDAVVSYITSTAYNPCYFNVTDLCRKWYRKTDAGATQNHGVAIRYPKGVDGADKYIEWQAAERYSVPPKLYIDYVSHAGLEGWWQYETMSSGRAGTANVDIYNGNLVYAHPDVAMSGNRMPVSVAHYYNSCLSESNPHYCGMGWRTSANQTMYYVTLSGNNYYVWTDGDGTEHYFKASGSQPYKDEEGMELKLTLASNVATIKDKSDTTMKFPQPNSTTKTYIDTVTDACGNEMKYTYSTVYAGRVEKITDGAKRDTLFSYNEGNLLSQITSPDGRSVNFAYDTEQRLGSIGYSDLGAQEKTVFAYEGNSNLLVSAKNYDGLKTTLEYEPEASYDIAAIDGFAAQARKVKFMEQTAGENDEVKGAKKLIEYLGMTTKIKAVKDAQSNEGKAITYQFNDAGNVVCMFDELGYAQSATFSSTLANTPESASKLQKAVINLSKNVAFDADWTSVKGTATDTAARDTATKCLNMPSVKIIKTAAPETLYRQETPIFQSGDYTFSAYVKSTDLPGGGAFVRMKSSDDTYESLKITMSTENSSCGPNAEGWERVQVTAYIDAVGENPTVTLEVVNKAQSGTVWFACPQLETGKIANRVNLVVNADFSRTVPSGERLFPDDWTIDSGIDASLLNGVVTEGHGMPEVLSGNAVRMVSYPAKGSVSYTQAIPVSGNQYDVFVFGGWVNSLSVASGNTLSAPCICYRFVNGSTNGDYTYCEFSREWVGWQFGCWAISAPMNYTKIEFSVNYSRNAQTAMFSNLFVHREQFGQSFAYDDKKNLISTSNLANTKSSMTYDGFDNLLTYVQPGADAADKYVMTYGSTDEDKKKHLLKTSTTPMGMKASYTHDGYGNVLTAVSQKEAGQPLIKSESEYDPDTIVDGVNQKDGGNYLLKSKDARGNEVTRTIGEDYTLESVADPEGQAVHYTYDAAKRVTEVETVTDEGSYKNTYTYEKDRLKTVKHNTTTNTPDVTYTFDYDELGRKTEVKVGDQLLSENFYTDDRSGLLEKVEYGNGGKVEYTYDPFDRLTGVSYDGEEDDRYTYEYGANGAASVLKDNHLNRAVLTEYDLAERPMQNTLRDAEGNLLYRTTLTYDGQNRLDTFKERVGDADTETSDKHYETSFSYDKDNRTTQVKYGDDVKKVNYAFDTLGRISTRTVTNGTSTYATQYTFVAGATEYGEGATTPLVATIAQGEGASAMNFAYEYDSRGNIVSETRNGAETTYEYDALGQLIRVNDPNDETAGEGGTTWTYEYDRGGNILSKKYYTYTMGTLDAAVEAVDYTYADADWKDKLTAYNGQEITYDSIGNPLTDETRRYEWQAGRQLKRVFVKPDLKKTIRPGVDASSGTVLKITFSNGNLIEGDVTATEASTSVFWNGTDVTSEYDETAFNWTRDSGDEVADAIWNVDHAEMSAIDLTAADLDGDVKIFCTLTGEAPTYGIVQVDETLVASHTPGEADAEDTFALENGNLSVTTARGDVYALVDGCLKGNMRLNGTVTASATVFASQPEDEVEFEYNHNGLRMQKKLTSIDGVTITNYSLCGKLITHLNVWRNPIDGEISTDELHFFYDIQSKPIMVEWNGMRYTYVRNFQNDIVGIIDNNGRLVVEYGYDAWGRLVHTKNDCEILSDLNPFRYRGYVWDIETKLYYLRSRLYNSEMGRFINEDRVLTNVMMGKNTFCYCLNSPIMSFDDNGISSDPYHDAVQFEVIRNSPYGTIQRDVAIIDLPKVLWRKGTEGEVDLFNSSTGEVWEVKKATEPPYKFDRQLKRYLEGTIPGFDGILIAGGNVPAGEFEYGDGIRIEYYSTGPGLIAYEVFRYEDGERVFIPIPSPERKRNLERNRERARGYNPAPEYVPPVPGVAVDVNWDNVRTGAIVVGAIVGGFLIIASGGLLAPAAAAGLAAAYTL